jgi:ComF family protein
MHKSKLRKKGYNHAALLAKKASKLLNKACEFDILEKKRDTIRQAKLSENERRINLTGAFSIHSEQMHKLKNKNILVVDDVITTGATIEECAKTLKIAGAKSVYALAIAKTRGTNIIDATAPINF